MRIIFILSFLSFGFIFLLLLGNDQNVSATTDSPLDYIEVGESTPNCGKAGKTPYIKNKHPTKSIRVNLHVKYKYEGQNLDREVGDYNIMPNQTKKLTSKCTVPGPSNQRFTYYDHAAIWIP